MNYSVHCLLRYTGSHLQFSNNKSLIFCMQMLFYLTVLSIMQVILFIACKGNSYPYAFTKFLVSKNSDGIQWETTLTYQNDEKITKGFTHMQGFTYAKSHIFKQVSKLHVNYTEDCQKTTAHQNNFIQKNRGVDQKPKNAKMAVVW